MSLIRKLDKDEGLPVFAFTFSRKRCNENAEKLSNLDLTSSKEKHEIHIFIEKCISRLKDQDKRLPQVIYKFSPSFYLLSIYNHNCTFFNPIIHYSIHIFHTDVCDVSQKDYSFF